MASRLRIDHIAWAPPEWACCGFPLEAPGQAVVCMETALAVLHGLADTITDADSTALGPAMHVAHMLVSRQGTDGMWPASLNACTGEVLNDERTAAPIRLYRRLTDLLRTTEFDHVVAFAEKQAHSLTHVRHLSAEPADF